MDLIKKLKNIKLFQFSKKRRTGKEQKAKKVKPKPDIATPKKRSPVVETLLYMLRVLWGAVKLLLCLTILVGFIGAGLGSGLIYGYIQTAPTISKPELEIVYYNTFIYDAEGEIIAELKRNENRVWIDYVDIPQNLINAFIAIEDKRFWEHKGVDLFRFLSSTYMSVREVMEGGSDFQGGSTITQQLVRNLTGNFEVTPKRKIQEVWQAIKLEREGLSKEDILTRYMNTIPMGSIIYGIETAAQAYYGKDVRELSLAECASLAGITNWPTRYIPNTETNRKNNMERAHLILDLMLEQGFISEVEHEQAKAQEIAFTFNPGAGKVTRTSIQTYFVDEVIKSVIRDISEQKGVSAQTAEDIVYNSGLRIYTTLEPKVQNALDSVYTDEAFFPRNVNKAADDREEIPQSAMVVMDPSTGAVRGLYGGYGPKEGSVFNRATQMVRSPGSAIKPLNIFAPGIEEGSITMATIIDDVPQHMRINDLSIPERERLQIYPRNVEGPRDNFGLTTVQEGLVRSRNVVAALLMRDFVGFRTSLTYMEKVNLPRWEDNGKISMAMGGFTNHMSPLDMTAAYSVFAFKGVYWEPFYYTEVTDYHGNVILEKKPNGKRVYSEQTSFIMNDMLQDVVKRGTASSIRVKNKNGVIIPAAGKTGTSDRNLDKWFCGTTPYYVASTWYGYDNKQVPISLVRAEYQGALKIWNAVMDKIHANLEPIEFFTTTPAKILKRTVCIDSGKLATPLCRQDPRGSRVAEMYFIDGTEPPYGDNCDVHYKALVCTVCKDEHGRPVLANEFCPPHLVREQVLIRRPIEYKPAYPTDPYPHDWQYEVYAGEYCTIHDRYTVIENTPGTILPQAPEPTIVPTPTPVLGY